MGSFNPGGGTAPSASDRITSGSASFIIDATGALTNSNPPNSDGSFDLYFSKAGDPTSFTRIRSFSPTGSLIFDAAPNANGQATLTLNSPYSSLRTFDATTDVEIITKAASAGGNVGAFFNSGDGVNTWIFGIDISGELIQSSLNSTGAGNATFVAANKPGANKTSPDTWLKIKDAISSQIGWIPVFYN